MNHGSLRAAAAAGIALCLAGTAAAQELRPDPGYSAAARQDRVEELERLVADANDRADRAEYRLRMAEDEIRRLQRMVSDLTIVRDAVDEMDAERARDQEGAVEPEGDLAEEELEGGDTPETVYANAQSLMRAGRLSEAEAEYARFLSLYDRDPNAPSAHYWRAFTQLARGDSREAALGFTHYLRTYPSGRYAPDALVRLGVALRGAGLPEDACRAFADFNRRYPRAERSLRDIAVRETRALNCA